MSQGTAPVAESAGENQTSLSEINIFYCNGLILLTAHLEASFFQETKTDLRIENLEPAQLYHQWKNAQYRKAMNNLIALDCIMRLAFHE